MEMAKLNLKEDSKSLFPHDKYRIWVQRVISSHTLPHLHIRCKTENWELKVHIETCELWEVVSKGTTKPEEFQDAINKLKEWFALPTTMPNRIGTNKRAAYDEWEACNAE